MSPEIPLFLNRWSASRTRTIALVESIGGIDPLFRPAPGYRNIHEQLAHIIAAQKSVVSGLGSGDFPWQGDIAAANAMAVGELVELAAIVDDDLRRLVRDRDEAWLQEVVGKYSLTRSEWLWITLDHEIYHTGQLSLSIRLAGGQPAKIFE